MLEIKDGKKILTTPVSAEDLKDIHAGDIIYLNGSMTTCRDVAHRRLVEEGRDRRHGVDVREQVQPRAPGLRQLVGLDHRHALFDEPDHRVALRRTDP